MKKLNLGCGIQIVTGWVNVDYSLGARLRKTPLLGTFTNNFFRHKWSKDIFLHNLNKKFPWRNDSIDIIYTSHTLEHFSKKQGVNILQECHRVLKKGGILRVVVPDLTHNINQYIQGNVSGDDFCDNIMVTYETPKGIIDSVMAPYTKVPHIHKCMYDHDSLEKSLNSIGFIATRKKSFESDIPDIKDVELDDRTKNAVIVEGKKQ